MLRERLLEKHGGRRWISLKQRAEPADLGDVGGAGRIAEPPRQRSRFFQQRLRCGEVVEEDGEVAVDVQALESCVARPSLDGEHLAEPVATLVEPAAGE